MSLKLRTRNHPSLQGCFSGMPLIPVLMLGVIMSSKPSKWLFDTIGKRHERNWREFSVAGFIFTYVKKNFSGPLMGYDRPLPYGSPLLAPRGH